MTLNQLVVLKYRDKEVEKIRILREAASKWRDIASLIYPDYDIKRMDALEQKHNDQVDCLRDTLIEGFIEKKPEGYTQDWNGFIELLDDADLNALAEKIKHALTCPLLKSDN